MALVMLRSLRGMLVRTMRRGNGLPPPTRPRARQTPKPWPTLGMPIPPFGRPFNPYPRDKYDQYPPLMRSTSFGGKWSNEPSTELLPVRLKCSHRHSASMVTALEPLSWLALWRSFPEIMRTTCPLPLPLPAAPSSAIATLRLPPV